MIIITGANGKLGRTIVERLLKKMPTHEIGLSVREPEKAQVFAERGVRVRQGDYADRSSLLHAFEGASQVLLVSSNSSGESAVAHHQNAIDAAKAVGALSVVYTSHMGSRAKSPFAPMIDHAATEEALRASGLAFVSLRNGFYADSALMIMGNALQTGQLVAPEDGPVSWTAHADLADAAVIALTDEGLFDGLTPSLTGSEALNLSDIARLASEAAGREIVRVTVTDEEYRASMIARGVPEPRAALLLGMFTASRRGEFAAVDPTLERLLGRAPISMREILAARVSG